MNNANLPVVRFSIAIATFTAVVCALPMSVHAQIARMEILAFPSTTLTDEEFLSGKREGKAVTITGALRIPKPGTEKLPLVVLLHGSGGISGFVTDWEQEFNAMGLATFVVDSWSGRGVASVVNNQSLLPRTVQLEDAFRALEVLEKHPRVDPARIAVMGFSRGGQASLYASSKRFQRAHGPASGREYAAYIALYPTCNPAYQNDEDVSAHPIRIFHGAADNYVPVAWCRDYAARLKKKGSDIVHTEFPGANHVFDWANLKPPVILDKAQTTRNCALEEGPGNVILNSKTKRPFTYADPCVEIGTTIAYDERASTETRKAVKEFLVGAFKP